MNMEKIDMTIKSAFDELPLEMKINFDAKTQKYFVEHGRAGAYKEIKATEGAYYDSMIKIDLSKLESMIALPFHPSNAWTIREFLANAKEILAELEADGGKVAAPAAAQEPEDQVSWLDMQGQQVIAALENITVETLTPIEAMNELYKLKLMLK